MWFLNVLFEVDLVYLSSVIHMVVRVRPTREPGYIFIVIYDQIWWYLKK